MNAAETYTARRHDITRLIDELKTELELADAAHAAQPGNWGFPGTLGKIREDLVNMVSFISGKDAGAIENVAAK